jgi:hypothetical protein
MGWMIPLFVLPFTLLVVLAQNFQLRTESGNSRCNLESDGRRFLANLFFSLTDVTRPLVLESLYLLKAQPLCLYN